MKKKIGIILLLIVVTVCVAIAFILLNIDSNKEYSIEKIDNWTYFNIINNGKNGVIDNKGNVVIEPKYSDIKIPNPTKDVFICINDNESIILNKDNKELFTNYEEVQAIELKELAVEIPYEKEVLKYKKNGKYGLINFEGKKITNAVYDEIENFNYKEGELLVKKNEKYGIINFKGNKIINIEYKSINDDLYYEDENSYKYSGYIALNEEDKYEYIKYNGEKLIKDSFEEIKRVNDVQNRDQIYLIYKNDGKYGVIENDKVIINNEYNEIEYDDLNNIFITLKGDKYGVLNDRGETILSNLYNNIEVEGLYIYAQNNSNEEVYNNKGEKQENVELKSEYPVENTDFIITIDNNNKYGVRKVSGEKILDNKYSYIEYLYDDYFIVSGNDGRNGIEKSDGTNVLEVKYDMIQKLEKSGLIEAHIYDDNKSYLYNKEMKEIIEKKDAKFIEHENYITIYSSTGIEYVNYNGEKVANSNLNNESAIYPDYKDGKWGFIDKQGNIKVEYIYDNITEFNIYGFAGVMKNGKWGCIDSDGTEIIDPKYSIENSNEISFIGEYYKVTYGYNKFYYTNNM